MLEAKHLLGQFFTQRAPILCGKRDVAVVAQNLFLECAGACTIDGLRGPVADVNILDVDFVCEADKYRPRVPEKNSVLEAKHLLGQFLRSEPRFYAGRGMWLWLPKSVLSKWRSLHKRRSSKTCC